jgi:hypothetical protein
MGKVNVDLDSYLWARGTPGFGGSNEVQKWISITLLPVQQIISMLQPLIIQPLCGFNS